MTEALHAPQPSELVEHFLAEAISNSPQPLKDLADFLSSALSEDDWKTADRLLLALALRTQTPDSWRPDREAVARIVDFQAWDFYDRHIGNPIMLAECKHEVGPSLAKADAILALRPQTAESGK